jgi:alcohol dehydrogenase class IV
MPEWTQPAQWNYPTHITHASKSSEQIHQQIRQLGAHTPLCVIDSFLLNHPSVINLIAECKNLQINCALFTDFAGNPTCQQVQAGQQACRNHQADCIVAIGGGSALDIAKVIAVTSNCDYSLWDFIDDDTPTPDLTTTQTVPIIAVPTTSGTGSEVSRAGLITHSETKDKKILFHPKMLPTRVICDPELLTTLPANLTAWTGMDALAHNLEALCSPRYHPQADGIAHEGIRLIKENLLTATQEPNNISARSHMMSASLMGATAFQKGLGAIHSLSHPVGGLYNAHHGLLNAIFMPYVLEFNRTFIEEKMTRLARYLDLPNPSYTSVFQWVLSLLQQLNIPSSLQLIGIDTQHTNTIAERALHDPSTTTNPRPLTLTDCRALFLAAQAGEIFQSTASEK